MITRLPRDQHDREQLANDLERIQKECPYFMAYMRSAVEETVEAFCEETRTEWQQRHSGACADLRTILAHISDPRLVLGVKAQLGDGMV